MESRLCWTSGGWRFSAMSRVFMNGPWEHAITPSTATRWQRQSCLKDLQLLRRLGKKARITQKEHKLQHSLFNVKELKMISNECVQCSMTAWHTTFLGFYNSTENITIIHISDLIQQCLNDIYGRPVKTASRSPTSQHLHSLDRAQMPAPGSWPVYQQKQQRGHTTGKSKLIWYVCK